MKSNGKSVKQRDGEATGSVGSVGLNPMVAMAGVLLLIVAVGASVMLSLESLGGLRLPGCGPESGCAKAAASVWGKVPGLGWPTSHVGTAYFLGLVIAWLATAGRLPGWMRWVVRLGALASIGFTVVMIVNGYVCAYCVTVHVANVAFVAMLEVVGRKDAGAPVAESVGLRAAVAFVAVFVISSGVLAVVQAKTKAEVEAKGEEERQESVRKIIEQGENGGGNGTLVVDKGGAGEETVGDGGEGGMVEVAGSGGEPFVGRYREGPEVAPIRIVIFSDYQCPDCRRVEGELRMVMERFEGVSFSHKHFPMCKDCNAWIAKSGQNPHPNACWAARAAEAAGELGGDEAFFEMHEWLFEEKGYFQAETLRPKVRSLGLDYQAFVQTMSGEAILEPIKKDIAEAVDLGVHYTPMIFINGVELKGWFPKEALVRTVAEVAATNPPARDFSGDQPPRAAEKYLADWREQHERRLPADSSDWSMGSDDAAATIVVWGDYEEPYTAELDERLRSLMAGRDDLRYSFRHYPINEACNSSTTITKHENTCRMHQAAEAAGRLGGVEAYWKMHAWLFSNQASYDDAALLAAAGGMGLDGSLLLAEMELPEVQAAIEEDAVAGKRSGLRGIPFAFVNGKRLPRWRLEGERIPERIVEEAAGR